MYILEILGVPLPTPLDQTGPNIACLSRPLVYAYMPIFILIGLLSPLRDEKSQFYRFSTLPSAVAPRRNCAQSPYTIVWRCLHDQRLSRPSLTQDL